MASDQKIFLDLNINADGERQLAQYQSAFNELKTSINNLSNPIIKLDDNLSDLTESINKLSSENGGLAGTIQKIKKSSESKTGIVEMEAACTAGLTVIIAFGPQLLEYAKAWFKGKEATEQAKLSLDALNKGISSTDYSKAIENVNALKQNKTDLLPAFKFNCSMN